jgi:hypothetical protein
MAERWPVRPARVTCAHGMVPWSGWRRARSDLAGVPSETFAAPMPATVE